MARVFPMTRWPDDPMTRFSAFQMARWPDPVFYSAVNLSSGPPSRWDLDSKELPDKVSGNSRKHGSNSQNLENKPFTPNGKTVTVWFLPDNSSRPEIFLFAPKNQAVQSNIRNRKRPGWHFG